MLFLYYIFMDYVSYLSCDVFDVVIFTCLICFCVCAHVTFDVYASM